MSTAVGPSRPPSRPPSGSASTPRRVLLAVLGVVVAVGLLAGLVLLAAWWQEPVEVESPGSATSAVEVVRDEPASALVTSATAVLEAWGNRGLDYPWWWAELRPMLSPGARAAYVHTDPEQLPALGEVRPVVQQTSGTTATVWFRTDAGRFGVDLSKSTADDTWRAHRILFPGQDSVLR